MFGIETHVYCSVTQWDTVVPQLSCINHARVCVYDVVAHVFLINTCAYVIMIDVIRACLGR